MGYRYRKRKEQGYLLILRCRRRLDCVWMLWRWSMCLGIGIFRGIPLRLGLKPLYDIVIVKIGNKILESDMSERFVLKLQS